MPRACAPQIVQARPLGVHFDRRAPAMGAFMPDALRPSLAAIAWPALLLTAGIVAGAAAPAENTWVEELVSAVVQIKTHINPEGRTISGLGREREGSGIVIDSD